MKFDFHEIESSHRRLVSSDILKCKPSWNKAILTFG